MMKQIRTRLAVRQMYDTTGGWLKGLCNSALSRAPWLSAPVFGSIWSVRLRGLGGLVYLRQGTSDWLTAREICFHRTYRHALEPAIRDVRVILDLGANIGLSVRLWQSRYPDARIVAVEPEQGNFDLCQQNIAAGPDALRVRLIRACVAGRCRDVFLDTSADHWAFRMVDSADDRAERVDALTVPEILSRTGADGRIDLLKCDVEGAEAEVFANCSSWIARIRNLVIETHAPYTPQLLAEDVKRNGGALTIRHQQQVTPHHALAFLSQD